MYTYNNSNAVATTDKNTSLSGIIGDLPQQKKILYV